MLKFLKKIIKYFRKIIGINYLDNKINNLNFEINNKLNEINKQILWIKDFSCSYNNVANASLQSGNILKQQKAGSKILEIFDEICNEYNLSYWMGAGNLIGYVRHNGNPVPWDDDVDVYMLRPDFEKAINIIPDLFNKKSFTAFYRGCSIKIIKYKDFITNFCIFPIDQYFKKIDSEEEKNNIYDKIASIYSFSNFDYIKASGYTNFNDYFENIWYGKGIITPEKLYELSGISRNKWNSIVMEGKSYSVDGHLFIGYERAGWPGKRYSWNYDWIFPLERAKYFGVNTNIPNNPNYYLNSQYGDIWTFPNDFSKHDHSKIKLTWEANESLEELLLLDIKEILR